MKSSRWSSWVDEGVGGENAAKTDEPGGEEAGEVTLLGGGVLFLLVAFVAAGLAIAAFTVASFRDHGGPIGMIEPSKSAEQYVAAGDIPT